MIYVKFVLNLLILSKVYGVVFEVRTELLNIILTSSVFEVLISSVSNTHKSVAAH
jgi:hypothetical protein